MADKEQFMTQGVIMMFIGGLLTIIGGVLLGITSIFSSLLTDPSDEFVISTMLLLVGIFFDILGICFYSSMFNLEDKETAKPHDVSNN